MDWSPWGCLGYIFESSRENRRLFCCSQPADEAIYPFCAFRANMPLCMFRKGAKAARRRPTQNHQGLSGPRAGSAFQKPSLLSAGRLAHAPSNLAAPCPPILASFSPPTVRCVASRGKGGARHRASTGNFIDQKHRPGGRYNPPILFLQTLSAVALAARRRPGGQVQHLDRAMDQHRLRRGSAAPTAPRRTMAGRAPHPSLLPLPSCLCLCAG